jgi:hypothetical protein
MRGQWSAIARPAALPPIFRWIRTAKKASFGAHPVFIGALMADLSHAIFSGSPIG